MSSVLSKDGIKQSILCDICNKQFKTMTKMKMHKVMHTREWKKNIHTKENKFIGKEKSIQSLNNIIKCEACNQSFQNAGDMSIHKVIHTIRKPKQKKMVRAPEEKEVTAKIVEEFFTCEICKTPFAHAIPWKVHISHCKESMLITRPLNEKEKSSFLCKYCKKTYKKEITLRKHMESKHN